MLNLIKKTNQLDGFYSQRTKVSELFEAISLSAKKARKPHVITSVKSLAKHFSRSQKTIYVYLNNLQEDGFLTVSKCDKEEIILHDGDLLSLKLIPTARVEVSNG